MNNHTYKSLSYLDGYLTIEQIDQLDGILDSNIASQQKWLKIIPLISGLNVPFNLQKSIFDFVYQEKTQAYAYIPPKDVLQKSYLAQWMAEIELDTVEAFHRFSIENKEQFWKHILDKLNLQFKKAYTSLMDIHDPINPRWLIGAEFNIVDNCLLHDKNKVAIIYSNSDGTIEELTYAELTAMVNKIANGLMKQGFKKGDRIAIDMTMTPVAVAIYLAIIKAGFSVVSIADSFASDEIKVRMDITDAKAIFSEDYILRNNKKIPLYEKVKQATNKPVIVVKVLESELQLREKDILFDELLYQASDEFESVSAFADQEINVLFSSGTTGEPKAIPWSHSTAIKVYSDSLLHFDTTGSDIWAWPTNLGWMMGPWVTLASLLHGATLALYYGSPTTESFAKFIERAQVTKLGVVPSIVSALRTNAILDSKVDWRSIQVFGSTGECSNFEDMLYLSSKANYAPVIEYCGGTEIGGSYITATTVEPLIPSTFTTPAFGLDLCLLDDNGNVIEDDKEGEVALIGPSFGLSLSLLNKDHYKLYYADMPEYNHQQLRRHGDEIKRIRNSDGVFYRAQGRADDTMNLGGIKISSAEVERCINRIEAIYESAAIAVNAVEGGPSKLVVFVVLSKEQSYSDLKRYMQQIINQNLNPLFKLAEVVITNKLPRTASNKVMRRVLRDSYLSNLKDS
ncbi:AMP-binding protein [Thiotrichales bacterium 19S3-7]|nr:AMP-binding protein [Thiotrichales bacterium 19S3-7]MCF6801476.1 AMP-binding protein [Thiotrichales bacterium 19S3-11]